MKKTIKAGSIVVVKNGAAFGNNSNTTTKILSRPGALGDYMTERVGKRYGTLPGVTAL